MRAGAAVHPTLEKCPTGIRGLDVITGGGLPRGRATLVCGGAGCGKTLLALEFLLRGVVDHGEPGVLLAFEETADELAANFASLGFDLRSLIDQGRLAVDHVALAETVLVEAGAYDLEGLFVRLGHAIARVGARRVVLDAIDNLFSALPRPELLRGELRRLLRWLKDKGVTAIVTSERGSETLSRSGIEEYVSDCVITLEHGVRDRICTRQLRVVKYRGSLHGTNEYPFLIDDRGLSVMPITSTTLEHPAFDERVSIGIPGVDEMLGGGGLFRGGTVLVSGTAGSGKTSITAHFVRAACARGERSIVFLFEEAPQQWLRNMRSIGLDLQPFVAAGLLRFHAARPSLQGLELHLAGMLAAVADFDPRHVVVDPISSFDELGDTRSVKAMLVRLVDGFKVDGRTVLMTSLTTAGHDLESTEQQISSIVDTWLLLRDVESSGERNRCLYILKSRGMAHSNQVREFVLTNDGALLRDVYIGEGEVLTGAARLAQQAREDAAALLLQQDLQRQRLALARKREALAGRIQALTAEFAGDEAELQRLIDEAELRLRRMGEQRNRMAGARASGGGAAP